LIIPNHILKAALSVIFCIFLAASAFADRVARILYYDAPAGAPENAFVYQTRTDKKSKAGKVVEAAQEIVLERHKFSKSFSLTGGDLRLAFLPSILPEDASFPAGAPGVDIPKQWKKVLILAFADPSNPTMPVRFKALNANDDVFGPGEMLFINFSKFSIFGLVGEKKLLLHPEKTAVISNPIPNKGEYQVKLDSVENDIESRRWLMRQTWRHHPNVRRLVFVLPLPAPRTVKLYTAPIRDF
jgi:hypothetical protein